MHNGIFITSTGTDIGKTFVTSALLFQMVRAGIAVQAIKPVASGIVAGDAQSDPARLLRAMGRPHHPSALQDICPWRFKAAIAANLAAAAEGETIAWTELVKFCQRKLLSRSVTLIEGAGGLMSPITDMKLVADLISELAMPAILVTGNYLGCISHTLTAIEALKNYNIPLLGLAICESEDPAVDQQQLTRMILNRQMEHLPLIWIPRTSTKADAYKFTPPLDALWNHHLSHLSS